MSNMRLAGVELYSGDLARARRFYEEILGLKVSDEEPGHHVMFDTGDAFLCIETTGFENDLSSDRALVFFEVDDLDHAIDRIGRDRFVKRDSAGWAVLHDPDAYNVLLLQKSRM